MKKVLASVAVLCAGVLSPALHASSAQAALPRAAAVPGGVALLPLGAVAADAERPRVWFGEQQVLVTEDTGQWLAVVGLALDTPAGEHELRVQTSGETRRLRFRVDTREYPEQRITIKDSSKVQLSASDLARAEAEFATIQQLKRHWREATDTDMAFILPARGRPTGRFGVRRFFNGEPRSPHAGFDIAVPRGATVSADAAGRVLAVDEFFFNGKTIFVDHGNGLISMYCHLDRSSVQAGDTVVKGQQIGEAGMSGRATGPHLHWSVILNGAMVDPELFLSDRSKRR